MEEVEDLEVLEIYELHYSNLILLSSSSASDCKLSMSSTEDQSRLETIKGTVMEILGPKGPGLLSITCVPNASLRLRNLLPLARNFALIDHDLRKRVLKEYNLGNDVLLKNPNRNVSSFAMQLKYAEALESAPDNPSHVTHLQSKSEETHLDADEVGKIQDGEFDNPA